MVPVAEGLADFREAHMSEVFGQCHRNLAGTRDVAVPFLRVHVGDLQLEELGDSFLDVLYRDLAVGHVEDVTQRIFCQVQGEFPSVEPRVGEHFLQGTLELANVGADVLCNEEGNIVCKNTFDVRVDLCF